MGGLIDVFEALPEKEGRGYRVFVALSETMGPGAFEGVVQIRTDCEPYPLHAMRVAGEVIGNVVVNTFVMKTVTNGG